MNSKPPFARLAIYALLALIGFFIADLGLLLLRGGMFPQQPPPAKQLSRTVQTAGGASLNAIRDRNLFNADGVIPPAKGGADDIKEQPKCPIDPPASTIQVTLLGTIVHANPKRSIATVSSKSKNDQFAVKVGDMIPDNIARVDGIARNRVILTPNGKPCPEFIELKEDSKILFGQAAVKPVQNGEVMQTGTNDFAVKRSDIDRLTNNLPELLQQARAVPRMGPNGQIECFSLADIAPGSIYERLGLRRGDCIKSVNGQKIDSPAKAMELYNALRSNADSVNLGIERGGRDEDMNYNITR